MEEKTNFTFFHSSQMKISIWLIWQYCICLTKNCLCMCLINWTVLSSVNPFSPGKQTFIVLVKCHEPWYQVNCVLCKLPLHFKASKYVNELICGINNKVYNYSYLKAFKCVNHTQEHQWHTLASFKTIMLKTIQFLWTWYKNKKIIT